MKNSESLNFLEIVKSTEKLNCSVLLNSRDLLKSLEKLKSFVFKKTLDLLKISEVVKKSVWLKTSELLNTKDGNLSEFVKVWDWVKRYIWPNWYVGVKVEVL